MSRDDLFHALAAHLSRFGRLTLGEAIRHARRMSLGDEDAVAAASRLNGKDGVQTFYVDRASTKARALEADEVREILVERRKDAVLVEVVWSTSEQFAVTLAMNHTLRQFPVVKQRSILVCHEKHGNRYYVVDSDEDLLQASLSVLRGRLKEGFWYRDPGPRPASPDFKEEDVKKIPVSMQAQARKALQDYEKRLDEWERENESWTRINQACASADCLLAWEILRSRDDYEYEQVSLEESRPPGSY